MKVDHIAKVRPLSAVPNNPKVLQQHPLRVACQAFRLSLPISDIFSRRAGRKAKKRRGRVPPVF